MYHTRNIMFTMLLIVIAMSGVVDADHVHSDDISRNERQTRATDLVTPEEGDDDANHWRSCLCNVQPTECPDCNCNCGNHTCECGQQKEDTVKPFLPRDCEDLMLIGGNHEDGLYTVYLGDRNTPYEVYCDMTTNGGGWLLFQKRFNGETNFTRTYYEYAVGFGNISGEFWLGNRALTLLTQQKHYTLRADMTDFDSTSVYAQYDTFRVGPSTDKYRLTVGEYSGTAGDDAHGMKYHNGMMFSAIDADHDTKGNEHCGRTHKGGWWFKTCDYVYPNGIYYDSPQSSSDCIRWHAFRGADNLKSIEFKVRPNP